MSMPCFLMAIATVAATGDGLDPAQPPTGVDVAREPKATTQPSEADKALIRKLLDGAQGKDKSPAIIRALDGMQASSVKLTLEFDPGGETQKIQRGIVRDLEQAIEEAWKSQKRRPTSQQSQSKSKPRRRSSKQSASADQKQATTPQGAGPKMDDSPTRGRPVAATTQPSGRLRELRRGWGHLPARQRDEVVQGFKQDFLTKYREWIERYYRALADPENQR